MVITAMENRVFKREDVEFSTFSSAYKISVNVHFKNNIANNSDMIFLDFEKERYSLKYKISFHFKDNKFALFNNYYSMLTLKLLTGQITLDTTKELLTNYGSLFADKEFYKNQKALNLLAFKLNYSNDQPKAIIDKDLVLEILSNLELKELFERDANSNKFTQREIDKAALGSFPIEL